MQKKISDNLFAFAFLANELVYCIYLAIAWTYISMEGKITFLSLAGLCFIGFVLRIALEHTHHNEAAAVITMVLVSGFGLGIASGVLLIIHGGKPYEGEKTPVSYGGSALKNALGNPNINYKKVARDLIDLELKYYHNSIDEETYDYQKCIMVSQLNIRLKDIRSIICSLESIKNKETIDINIYATTTNALNEELALIKKALNPDIELLLKEERAKEIEY